MTHASPAHAACSFAALSANDVRLPLRLSEEDAGVVLDADGRDVLTVDVNGERPDDQATSIARLLVVLVNAAAGFDRVATFPIQETD